MSKPSIRERLPMTELNKKSLTERDICTQFINKALEAVKRDERKFADYLLLYEPNVPLAVIEAKDNNRGSR